MHEGTQSCDGSREGGVVFGIEDIAAAPTIHSPSATYVGIGPFFQEISPDPKYACLHLGGELPTSTLPPSPECNPSAAPAMQKLSASLRGTFSIAQVVAFQGRAMVEPAFSQASDVRQDTQFIRGAARQQPARSS